MLRRFELPAILLVMLVAIVIVRPFGDFPLNDDENHAIGTWNFSRHHHFQFAIDTTPPLRAQVVWGAVWTWLFGESFEVLRASTLILGALTLLLINRLLMLGGVSPGLRFFATLAFLFNPLWFWSTNTYMTETPYIFASVLSLYCFFRALNDDSLPWFVAGCAAVAISWWIRQGIVNIFPPIIVLAAYRDRLTRRWKAMIAIAIAVAAGYAVMALMRPDLIVASPAEFHEHYKVWGQESFRIPEMLTMIFTYIFFNVQNSALFFLPLAAGAALSLPRMARRWQLVTLLAIAVLMLARMGSMIRQGMPLPYYAKERCCEVSYGNIFWNLGLGPPTIPDLWSFAHESTWRLSHGARVVLSYFSVVLAAVALGAVIFAWKTRARDSLLWRLAGASVIVGTVTLPVSQQYIDRYAIDTAWAAVILFALTIRWELPFVRAAAIAALVITAAFSMLATQEYFAMNRARWAAWWELRNRGVPIKSIDGGAEPYLYYELSQARTPRERRRMAFGGGKRSYVLAIEPLPGFRAIAHHPFTGWLGLHRAEIVTLERAPNQNGGQAPSPVNVPRSSSQLSAVSSQETRARLGRSPES